MIAATRGGRGGAARTLVLVAVATGLVLAALLWAAVPGADQAIAFDKTWSALDCSVAMGTPTTTKRGLLDDAPGAGAGNDSAFVYVRATTTSDEWCRWYTNLSFSNTFHRSLSVRAAVNDGARLRVSAFSAASCGGTELAGISWGAGFDVVADSTFRGFSRTMTAGTVRSVCVKLDDRSSTHSQRISALIDRIQFRSSTNLVGWQETFTKAN